MTNSEVLTILITSVVIIVSYLVGNISPATIMAKKNNIEIRKAGSGNAGATNVLRTLGKKAGIITLAVDVLKGALVVCIVKFGLVAYFNPEIFVNIYAIAGLAVFIGHIWPVFYGFKGGKGIATGFGAIVVMNYQIGLIALGIVIIVVLATRYVSLGAILAALSLPVLANYFEPQLILWLMLMMIIALYKHNGNISRLVKGEENKINFKK